ncbi:MAG: hypothetical protein NZ740_09195 [Kiritimatiellae bacterium]|nr:hypothetical protein [Kiritimatiellia bacterium]MDW8459268.1 hypothetical protein [Verrucomicrobiota bacterium]
MNPLYYNELRPSHRRCREHYRRTLAMGLVPLLIALYLARAYHPHIGPGLLANAGLALSGILFLWGVRNLQFEAPATRWGRWIAARLNDLFPPVVIVLQGWFVILAVGLLWFAILGLGLPATALDTGLLFLFIVFSTLLRLLAGTQPQHPSARRLLFQKGLACLNRIAAAVFFARLFTLVTAPPEAGSGSNVLAILIWILAILVILAAIVLFADFLVRKMPRHFSAPPEDSLD